MAVTTAAFGMGQNWSSRIYLIPEIVFGIRAGVFVQRSLKQRPETVEIIPQRSAPVFWISARSAESTQNDGALRRVDFQLCLPRHDPERNALLGGCDV